jgi:hypothetical protein
MLRKDKALLENLTRKYGKNYILNEISSETIKNAMVKADNLGRRKQRDYFANGLVRKEEKMVEDILDNLSLELIYDSFDGEEGFCYYIDKKYPILYSYEKFYEDGECGLRILTTPEFKFLKKYREAILTAFYQTTKMPIDSDTHFGITLTTDENSDWFFYELYFDKKGAREWANMLKKVNNRLNMNLDTDWHKYCDEL